MSKKALELKNVKKSIGKKEIIHGLSFEIFPGEVFGFLGPNGAGKTTTIRMIVGLMKLSSGDVVIHGHSVKNDFKKAISHVGAIVENPELYKHLSGYRNLLHYARMMDGVDKAQINKVVELVGLTGRIHEKVRTYSLGMRQRLGLAQALLHNPSILILDEPTNGLDPAGIREIRHYIRKLAEEEGLSVIVSSHLLSEMELMCDRIGIIQAGRLVGVQTVGDFVQDENEVKVRIKAEPAAGALAALKKLAPGREIEQTGGRLILNLEQESVPDAAAALVKNNIKIYEIRTESKTLEDKFLEVTGGQEIV